MPDLSVLLTPFQLALENFALRQQLAVYKRIDKGLRINARDRIFWISVMRMLKEALVIVQSATEMRWHRQGSRHYGRWKSRSTTSFPADGLSPFSVALPGEREHEPRSG